MPLINPTLGTIGVFTFALEQLPAAQAAAGDGRDRRPRLRRGVDPRGARQGGVHARRAAARRLGPHRRVHGRGQHLGPRSDDSGGRDDHRRRGVPEPSGRRARREPPHVGRAGARPVLHLARADDGALPRAARLRDVRSGAPGACAAGRPGRAGAAHAAARLAHCRSAHLLRSGRAHGAGPAAPRSRAACWRWSTPSWRSPTRSGPANSHGCTRPRYLRLENYRNNLVRLGWPEDELTDGGSDRLVDALVAWGDDDTIRDRVRAHLDAGADHVCIQVVREDRAELGLEELTALAPILLRDEPESEILQPWERLPAAMPPSARPAGGRGHGRCRDRPAWRTARTCRRRCRRRAAAPARPWPQCPGTSRPAPHGNAPGPARSRPP